MKYPTAVSNAATLMFGICNNHPFYNGNKRTALVSGLTHLDRNGLVLDNVTRKDLYDLMIDVAKHSVSRAVAKKAGISDIWDAEVAGVGRWLQDRVRKITRGERVITYGQLYRILEGFGYRMGDKKANKMDVLRHTKGLFGRPKVERVAKVACPGNASTVSINELKKIREQLGLREQDGTDSTAFYDTQSVIDGFVHQHRVVLRSLAKT